MRPSVLSRARYTELACGWRSPGLVHRLQQALDAAADCIVTVHHRPQEVEREGAPHQLHKAAMRGVLQAATLCP